MSKIIPKVKSVTVSGDYYNPHEKFAHPGDCNIGKLPKGGFQSTWNFSDKPNDWMNRRNSPTTTGGKKNG